MYLLEYGKLRAFVAEVAYFVVAWLDLDEKLDVLAGHVKRVSRGGMFEVSGLFFYAIADGVSELFTRCGRWRGSTGRSGLASPISEWG